MCKASRLSVSVLLAFSACSHVASQMPADAVEPDPVETDGDKYQAILDNEFVRVLRYHDEPGTKTHLHHHPHFVLYALAPFRRQLTFSDGSTKVREFAQGDVAWMPAQDHVGENIGTTPTEALLIELKSE